MHLSSCSYIVLDYFRQSLVLNEDFGVQTIVDTILTALDIVKLYYHFVVHQYF